MANDSDIPKVIKTSLSQEAEEIRKKNCLITNAKKMSNGSGFHTNFT